MAPSLPDDRSSGASGRVASHGRLRGAPALRLHLTLAVGLTICLTAFAFEISRALGGNTLSWAYVFEWPIFAAFALYMWWNLLHDEDGSRPRRAPTGGGSAADGGTASPTEGTPVGTKDDDPDPDLVAWQEYLRTMEAEEARLTEDPGAN